MDDFYVFLKNDRNFFLKQLHFIISLISFLFLILTNTIDSVIVALAIPGTVLNSALLLGLYCLDERHDTTDIEILISYGILNLLATMVFINKTLQMDKSIFHMLFLNTYIINILLCLCSGLLMLGEGVHRLIVTLVRNIYNSTQNSQNSQNLNVLFNGKEQPNSSINISTIHKTLNTPDVDNATNTSASVSNFNPLSMNTITYAEKDTNTNPYEDLLIGRKTVPTVVENYTECSHYRLNSEHDKHRDIGSEHRAVGNKLRADVASEHHAVDRHNSGDDGYISDDGYTTENDRRSGDGMHCNNNNNNNNNGKERKAQTQYFYPKPHVTRHVMRHPMNLNSQNSGFNEAGLPVFVDRYGKRYIASLAGVVENHRCSANNTDTSGGDCKKKVSTPIDEYYTNRKYSSSKITITPSKDEVTTNDGIISDSKVTQDTTNVTNTTTTIHTNNVNVTNHNTKHNSRVETNNIAKSKDKAADSNEFITNYNNYLAHLYKNNNNNNNSHSNNGRKLFNYKFYNHNYDYQWVCEA